MGDNLLSKQGAGSLPDFVVIGSMRSGTTLLYDLLSGVRGLCLARMKETDYFLEAKNYRRGADWYRRQFDSPEELCGEVSPNYTKRDVFPDAPENLYRANPEARLIYIVRDPVERAVSQYKHSFLMRQKPPAPHQLIDSQEGQHIIAASRYAWQLEPWINTFGQKALLILDFDDLITNPETVVKQICKFVGLENFERRDIPTDGNSSDRLATMPGWWLALRSTRAGDSLRAILPREFVRFAKQRLSNRKATVSVPEFPEFVKQEMRNLLADDTAHFRKMTGMAFSSWNNGLRVRKIIELLGGS